MVLNNLNISDDNHCTSLKLYLIVLSYQNVNITIILCVITHIIEVKKISFNRFVKKKIITSRELLVEHISR